MTEPYPGDLPDAPDRQDDYQEPDEPADFESVMADDDPGLDEDEEDADG
jgi:hypothetical protein